MIKLNKKAAANAGTFTTANKKNQADSFRLSDKIKVLYRYIRLSKVNKGAVIQAIYSLSNIDNAYINN